LEVRVQIERSPEPLHDDHRTPPRVGESRITRPATQEAEDGPQRHAADGATQIMVPGEEIAQPVRQREHPLPHRDIGEDVVDEMRGPSGHAPSTAARAHRPPLAREGDQTVGATGATSKPSEPAREPAASQKAPELLLDEAGQPFSVAQAGRLGAKGLEVLPDDLVKDLSGWIPRRVAGRGERHARDKASRMPAAISPARAGNTWRSGAPAPADADSACQFLRASEAVPMADSTTHVYHTTPVGQPGIVVWKRSSGGHLRTVLRGQKFR